MNAILGLIGDFANILIPIFTLLGIGGVISGFRLGSTAGQSANWKTVKGQVVGCRVVTEKMNARVGVVKATVNESYFVEIRYQYTVGGQGYTGYRFKVGQKAIEVGTRKEGERVAGNFKAAPSVTVYYDPKNPELAILKPGGDNSLIMGNLVIGIVMVVAALGMFLYYRTYG